MKRRFFLTGSAAALFALRSARLFAAPPSAKRLVFGSPSGVVGGKLATGVLEIINKQSNDSYALQVIDTRNTLQATETVKSAVPDGSTLLQVQSGAMTLFPSTYKGLKYNPETDFVPLAIVAEYAFTLTLGPAVPPQVTNIDTYLAWVNENPDYRDLGFALYGSQTHLMALMLAREKEVALRAQSYKTADSMLADLQKQNLAACITIAGNTVGLGAGVRSIAISSPKRLDALPDVATFSEQGLSQLAMQGWYGWFAPAGTPAATAQALRDQINAAKQTPDYIALEKRLLLTSVQAGPAQIKERISLETSEYRKLVQSYGLTQMTAAGRPMFEHVASTA